MITRKRGREATTRNRHRNTRNAWLALFVLLLPVVVQSIPGRFNNPAETHQQPPSLATLPIAPQVPAGNNRTSLADDADTGSSSSTTSSSSNTAESPSMVQIIETELWNGERWVGAPDRWTTQQGLACKSPADVAPMGWKIVLGEARDDYGWEYRVPQQQQQLQQQPVYPTRQRIWLLTTTTTKDAPLPPPPPRSPRPPKYPSSSSVMFLSPRRIQRIPLTVHHAMKQLPGTSQQLRSMTRTMLQYVQDDWNFKGFGWSFYKSVIFKHAAGFAFRIPITSNFGIFDRHPEWPKLSMSVTFFYPLTAYISFSGSVNVEYLKWVALQACIVLRHVIAMMLLLLARGLVLAGATLAFPITRQWYEVPLPHSVLPNLLQTLQERPKPTFSSTLQERVGVSYSWRYSAKRGYFTRRSVSHLYLPTLLSLLEIWDQSQRTGYHLWRKHRHRFLPLVSYHRYYLQRGRRYWAALVPMAAFRTRKSSPSKAITSNNFRQQQQHQHPPSLQPPPPPRSFSKSTTTSALDVDSDDEDIATDNFRGLGYSLRDTKWADWWLHRKTGSLGISTGYPSSDPPYFSCSAVLALSGFYFRRDTMSRPTATTTNDKKILMDDGDVSMVAKQQEQQLPTEADTTSSTESESEDYEDLSAGPILPDVNESVDLLSPSTTTVSSASVSKKTTATA